MRFFRSKKAIISALFALGTFAGAFSFYNVSSISRPQNNLVQAELQVAKQQSEVCSSRNAQGVGLRGEYFSKADFRGKLLLSRVDSTVDFSKDLEWPSGLATSRPQSVRWAGWIRPPLSGAYGFHTSISNARVIVGKDIVVDAGAAAVKNIELAAGRYYQVVIEAPNLEALNYDGLIRFEWTAPHGMRYVVPRALMFQPTEQVQKQDV
jgi:hypothetical protein